MCADVIYSLDGLSPGNSGAYSSNTLAPVNIPEPTAVIRAVDQVVTITITDYLPNTVHYSPRNDYVLPLLALANDHRLKANTNRQQLNMLITKQLNS